MPASDDLRHFKAADYDGFQLIPPSNAAWALVWGLVLGLIFAPVWK